MGRRRSENQLLRYAEHAVGRGVGQLTGIEAARTQMTVKGPLRFLLATVLALMALVAAPEARAHGPHRHDHAASSGYAGTPDTTPSRVNRHVTATPPRSGHGGFHCGAQMCCGSVCASCAQVIAYDLTLAPPQAEAARLSQPHTPTLSGLEAGGIRRPPKR